MTKFKKPLIYILIVVITCAASAVLTFWICSERTGAPPDKAMTAVVGKDKANEYEHIRYEFTRTYNLKDGTAIEGVCGSGDQSPK